jgi:hypothetical protein
LVLIARTDGVAWILAATDVSIHIDFNAGAALAGLPLAAIA